jgi:predicted alpha/beta-fold hydrolase
LAGFSLGGNFALRCTLAQANCHYELFQTVAICPVICPNDTMKTLADGIPFYESYFVRKWKESLLEKTRHFSHLRYQDKLKQVSTLKELNEYFIPTHTPFSDSDSYFDAYHLKDKRLESIPSPTTIITSEDDPIVRARMLPRQLNNPQLKVELSRYGSHCAFLKNYAMESWVDDRLVYLFQSQDQ